MLAAFVDTRRFRSRAITLVAVLIEKNNRNDRMRMLEIADADFALETPSGTGELTHGADKHGAPKQGQASGTR
jgi:hypothetical protein